MNEERDLQDMVEQGNGEKRPPAGKWLGIDYGDVRIGVAVSDALGIIAHGLETVRWNGRDLDWAIDRIVTLAREQAACGLVVGIPRRTDGKVGDSERKARDLAAVLGERTGLPVVLIDERYTTVVASRLMRESGRQASRNRGVIDQVAAQVILQEFLESRR
jgi:putative holliday junction resolvase